MKYIFSLLLIFGLMVTEEPQFSQSNRTQYYEFSKIVRKKGSNYGDRSLYRYLQQSPNNKISLLVFIAYQELKDTCSDNVRIALKIRRLLFKEINFFTTQNLYWRSSDSREFSH